ncbi:MAG: aspartate aminotransferase family protein [bacterium]
MSARNTLPVQGLDHADLLTEMAAFREGDASWQTGRTWSMVYYAGPAHHAFLKEAHNLFFTENALNPIAFKSLKRMEAEVVRMSARLMNGPATTCGIMTAGGTESILLAVKTYRDRARKKMPWILQPEMVAPETIHVAFGKACAYFGVKPRYVPVGPDFRADPAAMKKAMNRNTIFVAVSAPQYPHGVVDPVEEVAAICVKKGLPLHVDACVGGFILPFVEKLGYPVPRWDFRVEGVTSMSADVHKYGYASPKGASVVLYRDMKLMRHQFYVSTDWSGGIYASPGLLGSRPGGSIASAWASLMALGEDGMTRLAKDAMEVAAEMKAGLGAIPELRVLGDSVSPIVTYGSADERVDVYALADQLEARGWAVDRQQFPPSIHCTCNAHNRSVVAEYLGDVRDAVTYLKAHPEVASQGNAAMYGMMAKVPVRGLVKVAVRKIMEGMYGPEGEVPDLANLGSDGSLLFKAIDRYGDQAMAALGKLQAARDRLLRRKG